ncbi:sulfate/thiosulfate transporter subunit [Pelistega indica]|uniref:Sulfate transport system permease protein CysT n=1 Tax=Pelistega indica TaxID=1414851 RepID=V8FSJ0_9BURK|nr:sulfate/thiosulfate transporter subunit [Pelistega indica]
MTKFKNLKYKKNKTVFLRSKTILPGFGLSFGISLLSLSLLVFLPFAMLVYSTVGIGWDKFWQTILQEQVISAISLTLKMSLFAVLTNCIFGTMIAWVIVRYHFPFKSLINAIVDLPFALPTAVTGIALATLYSPNGWIGQWFNFKIAFTPIGIWIALVVVSLPFIVRTVQPVLEDLSVELEEAGATLGANSWTIFYRIILPELLPALIMGAGMAFARATGEYGSVIFIAGNIPNVSEILPVIITAKLEMFDTQGASAVALFMLLISFVILFVFNVAQWFFSRRLGAKV